MNLTDDDLRKIKTVVDTRADLQDLNFERRFAETEKRLMGKIDEAKDMLTEDITAFGGDVVKLKHHVGTVTHER